MKRLVGLALLGSFLILCACGQKAVTWQEQYDLGMRYLSEGNYEEAIIAFTAAIEIDPNQALAYVGRGDAYRGTRDIGENLDAAQTDYEKAISLDETNVDAYLGLADVFIIRGEYDRALEVLQQGLEKTGNNQALQDKLSEINGQESSKVIENEETSERIVGKTGEIFLIGKEYKDKIDGLFETYGQIIVRNASCGVRFLDASPVEIDGEIVLITVAELSYRKIISDDSQLYSFEDGKLVAGPLTGKPLLLEGYFTYNSQQVEVEGPSSEYRPGEPAEKPIYDLQPTGPYVFHLTAYQEIDNT